MTVSNSLGSTAILLNAAEVPKRGELLAIDIGTRMDNLDQDSHPYEFKNLMIAHVPESSDRTSNTLHKVGMTSPVFVPEMGNDRFQKINRAKRWCRYVLRTSTNDSVSVFILVPTVTHDGWIRTKIVLVVRPTKLERRKRQQRCENDLLEFGESRHATPGDSPSQVCRDRQNDKVHRRSSKAWVSFRKQWQEGKHADAGINHLYVEAPPL